MTRTKFKFVKNHADEWYIDLPDYIEQGGNYGDLQMVAGADVFLDIISQRNYQVSLFISTEEFDGCNELKFVSSNGPDSGAIYEIDEYEGKELKMDMWLCSVTYWLFDCYPEKIYFKKAQW